MTTDLWPRLRLGDALEMFRHAASGELAPAASHPAAIFGEVGRRVSESAVEELRRSVLALAEAHGFPRKPTVDRAHAFDVEVRWLLRDRLRLSWAEALSTEVWSFLALVPLVDVTRWRWSRQADINVERFVGTAVERHTWGRGWWQAELFAGRRDLLDRMREADLNQLFERPRLIGKPGVGIAIAERLLPLLQSGRYDNRALVRDLNKHALRSMAYVDVTFLEQDDLDEWLETVVLAVLEQSRANAGKQG